MKYVALLALAFLAPAYAETRIVLPAGVDPVHYDVSFTPDAAAARFSGSEAVQIVVSRQTSQIVLNAAELTISSAALSGRKETPSVSFDPKNETATFSFAQPVAPGTYTLSLNYEGRINAGAAGLFYLDYDKKRALFTQFENSDARRFLPCWDEPARKATFTLTAVVPANEMAVSNMPVAAEEPLANGLKRVRFQPSPKMSSYLLFFAAGDFERISQRVGAIDVGVVFRRGDAERARYALDSAVQILPYYNRYFGLDYPLPKLDIVAGPGTSQFFGAMENWGAIFSFDRDVLIDPKLSTQSERIGVYLTNAHEMAHMWFGDLVTMDWWDGIWLNEGFATWMEYKESAVFHPEWNLWLRSLASKERAMEIDAREGTHPVIQPISDVLQADQAFDAITYQKGMSVIRMLENYTGEEAWRSGVRAYLKAHAYGNAVTGELWNEIDKASPVPVSDVAQDFTLQAGVPLIRVEAKRGGIRLRQDQFFAMGPAASTLSWQVPVLTGTLESKSALRSIVSRERPAEIVLRRGALPIVNAGQTGYFRTLYDRKLTARIAAKFGSLGPDDQLGILNDTAALACAGYAPMGDFLRLTAAARPRMNPEVLSDFADELQSLDLHFRGQPGHAAFRAYALKILRPLFAPLGWTEKPGEASADTLLRRELLIVLGQLDAPEIVSEAKARFARYVADPASLSGELRSNVLAIVAMNADAAEWEELRTLAKNANSSVEQQRLFLLLGRASDDTLARRALELTLSDEVPATVKPALIGSVAGVRSTGGAVHPEMALDFALAHADRLADVLTPDDRQEFIPSLAAQSADLSTIAKLDSFAAANIPASARQTLIKAEASIRTAAMIRDKRLPEVIRWLKRHGR